MSPETKLLPEPCPFCKSKKITVEWEACAPLSEGDTNRRWFAECAQCCCQGPFCQKENQVIIAWNKRQPSEEVKVECTCPQFGCPVHTYQAPTVKESLSVEVVELWKVNWLHLGTTDHYAGLKKDIAHVCRDVTHAACIDEICINDIVQTFRNHGFVVVPRSAPLTKQFSDRQRANECIPTHGQVTPSAAVTPDHGPDSLRAGQSDQEAATCWNQSEVEEVLTEAKILLEGFAHFQHYVGGGCAGNQSTCENCKRENAIISRIDALLAKKGGQS